MILRLPLREDWITDFKSSIYLKTIDLEGSISVSLQVIKGNLYESIHLI